MHVRQRWRAIAAAAAAARARAVGFHTSLALKRAGHRVIGVDNFNSYYSVQLKRDRAAILASADVGVVEGDVCDAPLLARLLVARARRSSRRAGD